MKVLLCHASLGWGHKRAAEAIEDVLHARGVETETHDLLEFLPRPMGRFYSDSYTFMITKSRWMWRLIHDATDFPKSEYRPSKTWWQKWQFKNWKKRVEEGNFTHVFSTHFATSALLSEWKAAYHWDTRVFTIITDYTAHRYWKHKGLDHYFAPTDEVAGQLLASGMNPESITVSGIPISSAFSNILPKEEARAMWPTDPGTALVLVLCSGLDFKKTELLIKDTLQVQQPVHYLVSAGKHSPNEEFVKNLCDGDTRYTIFGFSSQIAQMMMAADLIVTKPGGLVVSESLATGLPQVLFYPIPGQEEANAEFLVQREAALCVKVRKGSFREAIESLLKDRSRLKAMAASAASLGKPLAARTIVDTALRLR